MYAAISVGILVVAMSIFFIYSSEQAKMRGQAFGKAMEFVQDDLRNKHMHSIQKCRCLNEAILVWRIF